MPRIPHGPVAARVDRHQDHWHPGLSAQHQRHFELGNHIGSAALPIITRADGVAPALQHQHIRLARQHLRQPPNDPAQRSTPEMIAEHPLIGAPHIAPGRLPRLIPAVKPKARIDRQRLLNEPQRIGIGRQITPNRAALQHVERNLAVPDSCQARAHRQRQARPCDHRRPDKRLEFCDQRCARRAIGPRQNLRQPSRAQIGRGGPLRPQPDHLDDHPGFTRNFDHCDLRHPRCSPRSQ